MFHVERTHPVRKSKKRMFHVERSPIDSIVAAGVEHGCSTWNEPTRLGSLKSGCSTWNGRLLILSGLQESYADVPRGTVAY